MPKPARVYQRLNAQNDPNGNPQRLYVVYRVGDGEDGDAVAVYDEAYRGRPDECRGMIELPPVSITRSDYHERIREARAAGILR